MIFVISVASLAPRSADPSNPLRICMHTPFWHWANRCCEKKKKKLIVEQDGRKILFLLHVIIRELCYVFGKDLILPFESGEWGK